MVEGDGKTPRGGGVRKEVDDRIGGGLVPRMNYDEGKTGGCATLMMNRKETGDGRWDEGYI